MNVMSRLAVEWTLYQTPRFRLAEFWCPPDSPRWRQPNVIPQRSHVVFPRTSTVIGHAGCEPTLANPNHVVFYNPGQRYRRMLHDPDGDRCWFVELDAELLAELAVGAEFRFAIGPSDASVRILLCTAVRHLASDRYDPLLVEEAVVTALGRTMVAATNFHGTRRAVASPRHRELVEQAKSLLTDTARERLPLSELGRRLGTSEFHLARVFRTGTGMSLHDYRNHLRLRMALEQLAHPDTNIADMAYALGYASHSHFTDSFRAAFGIAPSRVRGGIPRSTMRELHRMADRPTSQ
jgi:AraC-like DNA-binding protein